MTCSKQYDILRKLLGQRILILDGAMGTMIQKHKLTEEQYRGDRFKDWASDIKGNNDLLTLTQPQIIKEIHQQYFKAGADIIETNTFNSNSISMADYKMECLVYELNLAAAKLAKSAADQFTKNEPHKPRFVAGALGPTTRTASISPDVNNPAYRAINFDQLVEAGLVEHSAGGRGRRSHPYRLSEGVSLLHPTIRLAPREAEVFANGFANISPIRTGTYD